MKGQRQVGPKPTRPWPNNRPHPDKICKANNRSKEMDPDKLSLTR